MIYLDNAATTEVKQEVIEEMMTIMKSRYGNIDSTYKFSLEIKKELNEKKKVLKKVLGLNPNLFSFTTGGAEANNIAIASVARKFKKGHILISSIEHASILETVKELEKEGYIIGYIPVDKFGNIDLKYLEENIFEDTILVSVMGVNNEIGTITDMKKISEIIKSKNKNTYYHIDFVQGLLHLNFDFSKIGVDLLTISSHKIHGPKGIGALYIKEGILLKSNIYGENKENRYIPRTFPNELVFGFLKAIELGIDNNKISALKKYFLEKLKEFDNVKINTPSNSVDSILSISFLGVKSEVLLNYLSSNDIYVSIGSACSGNSKKSHVLKSIGLENSVIDSTIRISFSEYNEIYEIDRFFEIIKPFIEMVRMIK